MSKTFILHNNNPEKFLRQDHGKISIWPTLTVGRSLKAFQDKNLDSIYVTELYQAVR